VSALTGKQLGLVVPSSAIDRLRNSLRDSIIHEEVTKGRAMLRERFVSFGESCCNTSLKASSGSSESDDNFLKPGMPAAIADSRTNAYESCPSPATPCGTRAVCAARLRRGDAAGSGCIETYSNGSRGASLGTGVQETLPAWSRMGGLASELRQPLTKDKFLEGSVNIVVCMCIHTEAWSGRGHLDEANAVGRAEHEATLTWSGRETRLLQSSETHTVDFGFSSHG
jgi:hypothetical protein